MKDREGTVKSMVSLCPGYINPDHVLVACSCTRYMSCCMGNPDEGVRKPNGIIAFMESGGKLIHQA